MQQTSILKKINSPQDLKKLKERELKRLSEEIREKIVATVSQNGGHLASNLGVVELSIALHLVFDSPKDKIIWDVGHQCYAHKLLTGRINSFCKLRKQNGLAGFPKRSESPHDAFNTGHASTSISAALGILAAEKIKRGNGKSIAVIGDGALTGGLAYEALSHAGHLGLPLIVVLNDNKMSISPNVGGLSKYLSRLSLKAKYQTFRRHFDRLVKKIPFVGENFFDIIVRLKRAVKAVFYTDNFFVDLGFEYVGPISGHNINALISVFQDVRKITSPVVIHVITRKGKGYGFAEDEPDNYHGVSSFSVNGGLAGLLPASSLPADKTRTAVTFTDAFSRAVINAAKKESRLVAITAAMKTGTGLAGFSNEFPSRFFDVGIAEEHAITFACGLAAGGLIPLFAVYSTFAQRAADQIIHDAAFQKLPVILILDRAGFVGEDGETHQGLFDISIFRSTPNMTILAPASEKELSLMLEWAINKENSENRGPVIIRYPKADCPNEIAEFSLPIERGRGVFVQKNKTNVCLFFTGSLYSEVKKAAAILKEKNIDTDLYNLRFIKPVDEEHLALLITEYKTAVFIEEGMKEGGFGEYAADLAQRYDCKTKIYVIAAQSKFIEEGNALGTREQLLAENNLDSMGIAQTVSRLYLKEINISAG